MTYVPSSKGPAPIEGDGTMQPIEHHPSVACTCGHPRIDHVVTATGDNECWRCQCPRWTVLSNPSVTPEATVRVPLGRLAPAAEVIRDHFDQAEEDVTAGTIAEALADAGLLCTPEERVAIDAAVAETNAEDNLSQALSLALTAPRGSHRIDSADEARWRRTQAKVARRDAVRHLLDVRKDPP